MPGASSPIALADLRRDGGTQPRDHISLDVAKDYAEAMADGAVLPPVTAFFDGTDYWLADGFHRVEAHSLLSLDAILADVRQGTRRDAILFSAGANATHGYRRTNLDKRRAIITLLNDPEWSGWSDRAIAKHCLVDGKTVSSLRPKPQPSRDDTAEIRSEPVRIFLNRHGNPSVMKVGAIGKRTPPAPTPIAGHVPDPTPEPNMAKRDQRLIPSPAPDGTVESSVTASEMTTVTDLPTPAYDFEEGRTLLGITDAIELIAHGPSASASLAMWGRFRGSALPAGTVEALLAWVTEFAAGFSAVERKRLHAVDAMLERIEQDVAA